MNSIYLIALCTHFIKSPERIQGEHPKGVHLKETIVAKWKRKQTENHVKAGAMACGMLGLGVVGRWWDR